LKKGLILCIITIFILTTLAPISYGYNFHNTNDDVEYWALLIAVGLYAGHPDEDRPRMLTAVEELYNMLLVSTYWKEENIKVIKGTLTYFLAIYIVFHHVFFDQRNQLIS
jgi:hypothetical protein